MRATRIPRKNERPPADTAAHQAKAPTATVRPPHQAQRAAALRRPIATTATTDATIADPAVAQGSLFPTRPPDRPGWAHDKLTNTPTAVVSRTARTAVTFHTVAPVLPCRTGKAVSGTT